MEFTEAGVYEALGLEVPAEGAKEQEVTDPAQQPDGGQVQEVADPELMDDPDPIEDPDTETEAGLADNTADDPGTDDKPPLTKEQRRANAARRRQEEQQAAIDKALAEERAKNAEVMAGIIKNMGLRDPASGKPVETLEQLQAFQKQQQDATFQRNLKEGKLTRDDIAQVVTDLQQQAQQQADNQQKQQEAQQRINAEMAKIMEMDKSIKSTGDLLTMPGAQEFREKVGKGYSLLDAFLLVRGPELQQAKDAAVKQAAMNNARGKDHMRATGSSRGTGADSVPQDELAMYRLINPGATDAQIQAHYNKNKRK